MPLMQTRIFHVSRALTAAALVVLANATVGTLAPSQSAAAASSLSNPSLESGWTACSPATCWQLGATGPGVATLTATRTAYIGTKAARLNVSRLDAAANRKVVIDQQNVQCAPRVSAGHRYTVSIRYR